MKIKDTLGHMCDPDSCEFYGDTKQKTTMTKHSFNDK